MDDLRYLRGYNERVLNQVRALIDSGRLGEVLRNRYSSRHQVRDDKALFEYVVQIKDRYMR